MKLMKWWKLSSDESYLVMKVILWWKLSSDESYPVMKVLSDESYLVMKVTQQWKLPSDESYLVMKVILWWYLFSDESWNCQRSVKEWWLVTFRLWRCFLLLHWQSPGSLQPLSRRMIQSGSMGSTREFLLRTLCKLSSSTIGWSRMPIPRNWQLSLL